MIAMEQLVSQGKPLDMRAEALGELRESNGLLGDADALRRQMADDGYLFFRGLLDRDKVESARAEMLGRVAAEDGLDPSAPLLDGKLRENARVGFRPDLTRKSVALRDLLFDGEIMAFFTTFLGGEVRHFDYIWLRSVSPGRGTPPHGDSVFMNRGTLDLFTAWTPLGDIDTRLGGLIVLENSHKLEHIREAYGRLDVDTYCENRDGATVHSVPDIESWFGQISSNPVELREDLGGRWLTTDFRMGDLLVFSMFTLHASLDNQTERHLRLSSDTRYQLMSEPVDERWIGEDPIAHGPEAKVGIIC
ncbi:MAG TPA: phytanoyl-CoA dioxygenase family protein [Thermomicrobiales bacterium]|nr:phytanoyl-CoA dioxygenase family protein [Thermomicrobiales bacterium]